MDHIFVLALSVIVAAVLGGGVPRESIATSMLTCYVSLIFVSIGLLPLLPLSARFGQISVGTVVGAGCSRRCFSGGHDSCHCARPSTRAWCSGVIVRAHIRPWLLCCGAGGVFSRVEPRSHTVVAGGACSAS